MRKVYNMFTIANAYSNNISTLTIFSTKSYTTLTNKIYTTTHIIISTMQV